MNTIPASAFNQVPANARPSGFYGEIDDSGAGFFSQNQVALIVGQRLATGTINEAIPTLIPGGGDAAKEYFGQGSQVANMVTAFRANNATSTLYVIALDDNVAGVAAALDVTLTGAATSAGTLNLYIGDDRVQAGVASGDDVTAMALAIETAINANADLPVTASAALGVVTITSRHKGECGNDIRLKMNVAGLLGGEVTPAGVAVAIPGTEGSLVGGTSNPDQTPVITAMGDTEYDYVVMPYTDTASMDAWAVEMDRRWGATVEVYGIAITARDGSLSDLVTFGESRKATSGSQYFTCLGLYNGQSPAWLRAARYGAQCAFSLSNHPARPLQTLGLVGEMAPAELDVFTWSDRNTLLFAGIATPMVQAGGTVRIDRAVTLYQENAYGTPDPTWLDVTTPATLTVIIRRLRYIAETRYIERRCVLVNDGTPVASGIPFITPGLARADMIAEYDALMYEALAENKAGFEAGLLVGRDTNDPTRLSVIYTPDLANPLVIFATQVRFSLQLAN